MSTCTKQPPTKARPGFTIVELLIVIVVIAILAVITVVAYKGISSRTQASAAASAAEQAAKKLLTYAIANGEQYPTTLADAGVSDGSAVYQYRVDNSAAPKTFCLTATSRNVSYFVSSTVTTPTAGVCAGHAATGQTPVTNLVLNPRMVQSGSTAEALLRFGWGRTYPSAGDGPPGIGTYMRATVNSGSTGTGRGSDWYLNLDVSPDAYAASPNPKTLPVTAGESLVVSVWVRTSRVANVGIRYRIHDGTDWLTSQETAHASTTQSGEWLRISGTITVAATGYLALRNSVDASGWSSTDTFDQTALMITKGSTLHAFADGTTAGWIWNGTANNSTSTGPAP